MLFHDPILSLDTDRHEVVISPKRERPRIHGKFLYQGNAKLWIRGVTYGTFRPDIEGDQFPSRHVVAEDFSRMVAHGFNAIRTYTVPPTWLLDLAEEQGLLMMVGLPWEQHITFLDDPKHIASIEERVRHSIQSCAGHPAILGYAVGNEIPSPIVRWHGQEKVELFLERLYRIVKAEDPEGLVTYVNYPTTEYLHLPFLDFVCFNVYLESEDTLNPYLARLQNIANERPLVLAEIGLDSMRKGEDTQAEVLDWQIRAVGAAGGAGAFIFAWTDEWYRGGYEIEDWDFGLTDRGRQSKPALGTVQQAFQEFPIQSNSEWPRISVVVCSYNGSRTIRDCLDALLQIDYPDYEVIVVNDGSTDQTESIANDYPFRVISTTNQGLSNARNTGMHAASGEIVAYTDDDAYPDPHWLTYLAHMFLTTSHAAVGGPNLPPKDDGWVAECVAHAPGGPIHVLLNDQLAEHIPGCNMAFRKSHLQAIGGFDPQYRAAGDDVDICWRLQEKGWTIGFHAAAQVWHHRRNSVRTYWKQQRGYGRAEALLEQKWPKKYNVAGHVSWEGRLYGKGTTSAGFGRTSRVYQGVWGSAPFQLMYQADPSKALSILSMPEWSVAVVTFACLSLAGLLWTPLLVAVPLFFLAIGTTGYLAFRRARRSPFEIPTTSFQRMQSQLVTAGLHLLQPIARLTGRFSSGLTPWRTRVTNRFILPSTRIFTAWSETWESLPDRLEKLETSMQEKRLSVNRGGDYDQWDLQVKSGVFGGSRMQMVIEEHGAQKQLIRCRTRPIFSKVALACVATLGLLGVWACADQAWTVGTILASGSLLLGLRAHQEYSSATLTIQEGLREIVESNVLTELDTEEEESLYPEPASC
ncbi:MAG: glycosyltransferase [Nitrospirales bacterium]